MAEARVLVVNTKPICEPCAEVTVQLARDEVEGFLLCVEVVRDAGLVHGIDVGLQVQLHLVNGVDVSHLDFV